MKERRNALTILLDAGLEVRFEKQDKDYIAIAKYKLHAWPEYITTEGCASTDSAAKVLLRMCREQDLVKCQL